MKQLYLVIIVLLPMNVLASKPLSDGGVRDLIISGNISAYEGDCPCPYSVDKRKDTCGDHSAYSVYPGEIKCYPGDISDAEVRQYREQYLVDEPKLPWEKSKKEGY
ncbi:MAG: hypothetical protein JSS07_01935 [Proteobacteria bacterium]|nr:hypothetical protein [Pseudomonadota bacterium]